MLPYDSLLPYRIAFASIKGMTLRFAEDILSRIGGDEELFFTATTSQLKALLGFDSKILEAGYRAELIDKSRYEAQYCEEKGIKILYFDGDSSFPQRLRECDDAPALVYSLGDCDLNSSHIVSVVGTRHATMYGVNFVNELVSVLSQMLPSVVVVSGLAYGIDVAAHKASLSNKVPTVGVLAHGLSTIYPSMHRTIAAEIVKANGALLTEYPHNASIYKQGFIARNRIVAGMSDCTIVVESARKGGSLITADIAGAYNRDVFALPGRVGDTYSEGCNRLIADNKASLIMSPEDIIEFMGWELLPREVDIPKLFPELNDEERLIYDFLEKNGDGFINRISVETGLPVHRLMSLLINMEFKGIIANLPGGLYRLK